MDKRVLYSLSYGMYIVTSSYGEDKGIQIANTVFQISSNVPTVGISINRENFTHSIIEKSGLFGVSILSKDAPIEFIGKLGFRSGRNTNKYEELTYRIIDDVPVVIDYSVGYMVCKVINSVEVYTHTLFIGEILKAESLIDNDVMTYSFYRKEKKGITPPASPSYIEEKEKIVDDRIYRKYECRVCGYKYDEEWGDPSSGIKPKTKFEDLPPDWKCPICGAGKEEFVPE